MRTRTRLRRWLLALVLVVLAGGCGDDSEGSGSPTTANQQYPATPRTVFGGDRPVTIQVPGNYQPSDSHPLLVILHGYGADGMVQEQYLRLAQLVDGEGVLILAPDGTIDDTGSRFWNLTDAGAEAVDDVGYIRGLIAEVRRDYNVDSHRIYLVGHSNGAFLSHLLACKAASEIAAIVSIAGATVIDAADCKPSEPVSVLDIHGDADDTVYYDGGTIIGVPYPSAAQTLAHWQGYDRCAPTLVTDPLSIDLDRSLAGDETDRQRYEGCANGTGVELWTIHGGAHIPTLARDFATRVWSWLSAHPKR